MQGVESHNKSKKRTQEATRGASRENAEAYSNIKKAAIGRGAKVTGIVYPSIHTKMLKLKSK